MKKIPRPTSKKWLTGAAAGLATLSGGERLAGAPWIQLSDSALHRAAKQARFVSGYENVLGTSLDLIVEVPRPAEAAECEARLLAEIERLRKIFSTYDPGSEIRRVMAGAPVESEELAELLAAYETWGARTDGLIAVNLGGVIGEWRRALREGHLPERDALLRAAQRPRAYNVDALGKGYIIDRAVAVARRFATGGLVNLGGDLRAWGDTAWPVAVADPQHPAENAPALARFTLRDAAVATSGGYARYITHAGTRFSHLIDPRTHWPLAVGGSATFVANDSVTANALSTAASIGGIEVGKTLAQANRASGYVLIDAAGRSASGGLLAAATPTPAPTAPNNAPASEGSSSDTAKQAPADTDWPADFAATIQIALKKIESNKPVYRSYVVVWVRNTKNQIVRTITLWGTDERYQRKLSTWWNEPRGSDVEPVMTSRATRPAGVYTVTWDGRDDFRKRLPMGTYTLCLEICREDGHHVTEKVEMICGKEPVTATFRETVESNSSTIVYGPAEPTAEKR